MELDLVTARKKIMEQFVSRAISTQNRHFRYLGQVVHKDGNIEDDPEIEQQLVG